MKLDLNVADTSKSTSTYTKWWLDTIDG